jgi:hypothetical protein
MAGEWKLDVPSAQRFAGRPGVTISFIILIKLSEVYLA